MFNKKLFFALSCCFFASISSAQTLPEALTHAYKTNPELKSSRNTLQSIDETMAIAKSGYRPTVDVQGNYSYSDIDSENPSAGNSGNQDNIGIQASQSLFSGFQTINAVKASKYAIKSAQNSFFNTEQNVLLQAATSYLNVLKAEATVKLQENNEALLQQRLDETLKRFDVGEVTRTDVSQAKARHAEAKSDTINAKGTLEAIKAEYEKTIGTKPGTLSEPTFISAILPASLQEAISFAQANNYSIKQAKHNYTSKAYTVAQNAGKLLPSLNLNASAERNNADTDNALYGGSIETDSLNVGLNLNVPIYDAGLNRAVLRQSKYQRASAADDIITATRQAIADTSATYQLMVSAKAQLEAIDAQIAANQLALDGVQKEEALGNRTLLNVLDAYQELLNSEVEKEVAKENYYLSSLQLLLSIGKLTATDLKLDVTTYDPTQNYKETKGKWLSTATNEDK